MDKTILNILKKLEKNNYKAFVVGGYVRDKILGIETNDVDICTDALPKDVINIFNINKLNNEYGCVNIKTKKYNIDITTFRKENNYSNHVPKTIKYIRDVKTDLERRDFTINSILMNSKEEVIDYFNGVDDLKNKKIRCIGDVSFKLKEDPLRILRAIRLSVKYNLELDDEIVKFIKDNKTLVNNISYYRKKEELDKILYSKNKLLGLKMLKELNINSNMGLSYNKVFYCEDILGMYAQISFDDKYVFTKNEKEIISKIREILKNKKIDNFILYKYGLYVCSIAGEILGIDYKFLNKMYRALPIKSREDVKISLQSIVKLNNNCYNDVSKIFLSIETNILNGTLKNKGKDIVKFIRK